VKKTIIILTLAFVFTLAICGSASAATESYNIGQEATQNAIADTQLGFSSANGTLVITNAGATELNGNSTEGGQQAVVDTTATLTSDQQVTYGKGNMVVLNKPNDLLEFTFVTKENNVLLAKRFYMNSDGALTSGATVYISDNMAESNWNTIIAALGKNAYDIVGIANLWAYGAPSDLLKVAGTSGVSEGLLTGYVSSKSFYENFPLVSNQQSYHAMVSPGAGDDDVPMTILDVVPLKWVGSGSSQVYNYQALNNGDPNENIYILWDRSSNTGILALMKHNENLVNEFTAQTGITVVSGGLSEIKYALWLFNKMKTDPGSLITLDKLASINKADFDYLWGTAMIDPTDPTKTNVIFNPGHGFDKAYINNLPNYAHNYQYQNILPLNNYQSMENIGSQAAQIAQGLLGFNNGDSNLLVITSAGYSLLDNQATLGALDGIISVTGSTIGNLFSLKRGLWTPLWFLFVQKGINGELNSVFIRYNEISQTLEAIPVVYNGNSYNIFDISGANLAGGSGSAGWNKSLAVYNAYTYNIPDSAQQDYYLVSLANQWAYGMPYAFLKSAIGGGCPGSGLTQGYLIADYVKNNFPVGANQIYIYLSITAHCKEQVLIDSLGLSAAQGTYYTTGLRYSTDNQAAGIFLRWNTLTNTGEAILLDLNTAIINQLQPANNYYYKTMYWAIWYLDQAFPGKPLHDTAMTAFTVARIIPVTPSDFYEMAAAGGNPPKYIDGFVIPTPSPTTVTPGGIGQGTSWGQQLSGFIGGFANSALAVQGISTANIASGLPIPASTANTASTTGSASDSGIIFWILGALMVIVAVIVLYLTRDTIAAVVLGSERLGK
jgi:Protein containing a metal-binding domain shared with formylmethanofuran dehydrogenase subunit E